MSKWLVEYAHYVKFEPNRPDEETEIPCFRIFPEHAPENWIAETNSDLPAEVQEEMALIMARALTDILSI